MENTVIRFELGNARIRIELNKITEKAWIHVNNQKLMCIECDEMEETDKYVAFRFKHNMKEVIYK